MTDILTEVKSVGDMARGINDNLSRFNHDLEEVKNAVAGLQKASLYAPGVKGREVSPEVKSMIDYMVGRTSEVKAAAPSTTQAVLNPANGGYMAVEEYSNKVVELMADSNPLMSEVDLMSIGANVLGIPVEHERPAVTFQGELDTTPASTVKVGMVHIPVKQAATKVPLTRVLVQASNLVDIEQYTAQAVAKAIADKMGEVIIKGDGVAQPSGIINTPGLTTMKSGASKSVTVDALLDVVGNLPEKADPNAKWFMKKSTFFKVASVFGKESTYVHMGLGQDIPRSLFGYPVVFCDAMPDATADGNIAMLFGDMKAYKAVQAGGIEYLRDPYTDSDQGVINMRYWTGLGGALVQKKAIIGVKVGA